MKKVLPLIYILFALTFIFIGCVSEVTRSEVSKDDYAVILTATDGMFEIAE